MICISTYKIKNYKYGVISYIIKTNNIYIFIMPKYTNYKNNH